MIDSSSCQHQIRADIGNCMKIFVISLLRSKDRRRSIQEQLDSAGLEFEFIDAVDGYNLSQEEIVAECDIEAIQCNPKWLNRGALGCALSHRNAYRKVIEQNFDYALILEDDMLVPRELSHILEAVERSIKDDEIVMLYYRNFKTTYLSSKQPRNLPGNYQILFPLNKENTLTTAGGYVVSQSVCHSLLKVTTPVKVTSDSWTYFMENGGLGRISVVYPRPLNDANFKSSIDYLEAYGSRSLSLVFKFINNTKLPIAYSLLKHLRKRRETAMSDFKVIDQPSEFNSIE